MRDVPVAVILVTLLLPIFFLVYSPISIAQSQYSWEGTWEVTGETDADTPQLATMTLKQDGSKVTGTGTSSWEGEEIRLEIAGQIKEDGGLYAVVNCVDYGPCSIFAVHMSSDGLTFFGYWATYGRDEDIVNKEFEFRARRASATTTEVSHIDLFADQEFTEAVGPNGAFNLRVSVFSEGPYGVPDGTSVEFLVEDHDGRSLAGARVEPRVAATVNSGVTVQFIPPAPQYWDDHDQRGENTRNRIKVTATCGGKSTSLDIEIVPTVPPSTKRQLHVELVESKVDYTGCELTIRAYYYDSKKALDIYPPSADLEIAIRDKETGQPPPSGISPVYLMTSSGPPCPGPLPCAVWPWIWKESELGRTWVLEITASAPGYSSGSTRTEVTAMGGVRVEVDPEQTTVRTGDAPLNIRTAIYVSNPQGVTDGTRVEFRLEDSSGYLGGAKLSTFIEWTADGIVPDVEFFPPGKEYWQAHNPNEQNYITVIAKCMGVEGSEIIYIEPGEEPVISISKSTITPVANALYSVFAGSPDNAWAVGTNGWIVNWDGSTWTLVPSPRDSSRSNTLYSVFMVDSDDVWAVGGDGWIIHWDGNEWSNVQSPTRDTLMSVYMLGQDDGWAVGHSGRIIHWDGESWSNVDSPTKQRLRSVSADVSGDEAYAVGDYGAMIHWTRSWNEWRLEKEEEMPYTKEWLNSVCMLDTHDVWAVGNLGIMIHYDGQNWNKVVSPTPNNLNSIFMLSSFQGVAVGDRGRIIYWDGDSWSNVKSSAQASLFSVSIEKVTGIGEAVGVAGNVVQFQVPPLYYKPVETLYYGPEQASTSISEEVSYTVTSLQGPTTSASAGTLGSYFAAMGIVAVAAMSILLLRRRLMHKGKEAHPPSDRKEG